MNMYFFGTYTNAIFQKKKMEIYFITHKNFSREYKFGKSPFHIHDFFLNIIKNLCVL